MSSLTNNCSNRFLNLNVLIGRYALISDKFSYNYSKFLGLKWTNLLNGRAWRLCWSQMTIFEIMFSISSRHMNYIWSNGNLAWIKLWLYVENKFVLRLFLWVLRSWRQWGHRWATNNFWRASLQACQPRAMASSLKYMKISSRWFFS